MAKAKIINFVQLYDDLCQVFEKFFRTQFAGDDVDFVQDSADLPVPFRCIDLAANFVDLAHNCCPCVYGVDGVLGGRAMFIKSDGDACGTSVTFNLLPPGFPGAKVCSRCCPAVLHCVRPDDPSDLDWTL